MIAIDRIPQIKVLDLLTLHIPDEAVPALKAKASGVPLETFAEQILMEQIQDAGTAPASSFAAAARRLGAFGKRHGLPLGGLTMRQLSTRAGRDAFGSRRGLLTWCFPGEESRKAEEISERIAAGDKPAVTSFWRYEVLNALLMGMN